MLINKILCMRKILFILLIITMAGCSSKKKDLFEVITYECEQKEESLNLQFEFRGGVELPLEKICDSYKSLQDSIISVMFGEELVDYPTKKALRVYADSSFAEYKKVHEEIFDNAQSMMHDAQLYNYETDIKGKILFYDSNVLSYQRELYTYAGGAHGMTTKTNYVFDIKTGKILTEEDVFGKGFERKITKQLIEKANILRAKGELPEEDELYNSWNIIPNGNFALTDSSVIYTFNPYEIAPYCYGIIDIELKLEN